MKCPGKENEWNDQHWEDILILGQILSNSTVRNMWRTVKRIYMLILGLKVQSGSQSSIFCSGPNPGSWHLSTNTAVGKRAKNVFPGVLTIYIGDAKILIGKSNGSRHSVWGASENMSCDLRGWNFSALFNLFIWFEFTLYGSISHQVKFSSLCLCRRFPPGFG